MKKARFIPLWAILIAAFFFTPSAAAGHVWNANWKISGIADSNTYGSQSVLWRDLAAGETIVWFMEPELHSATGHLQSRRPPWGVINTVYFPRDASSRSQNRLMCEIFSGRIGWKNIATGESVVCYMRGLFHLDAISIKARAPPAGHAASRDVDATVDCGIGPGYISTVSFIYQPLRTSIPSTIIFRSRSIRAPPYQSFIRIFQKEFISSMRFSGTEGGHPRACGMYRLTVPILQLL